MQSPAQTIPKQKDLLEVNKPMVFTLILNYFLNLAQNAVYKADFKKQCFICVNLFYKYRL